MSRKSGNRFSDQDMRHVKESRAHHDSTQPGCALGRACADDHGRHVMPYKRCLFVLVASLGLAVAEAEAFDDAQYPDLRGAWFRIGSGSYDPSKPSGLGQQAPLTPAYRRILEASLADQANGGQGEN